VDRATYPHIWQVRHELPDVDDDAIFETVLSLVLGGLIARAPRPCACHTQARLPLVPGRPRVRVRG
jgi:hypothetical protein